MTPALEFEMQRHALAHPLTQAESASAQSYFRTLGYYGVGLTVNK